MSDRSLGWPFESIIRRTTAMAQIVMRKNYGREFLDWPWFSSQGAIKRILRFFIGPLWYTREWIAVRREIPWDPSMWPKIHRHERHCQSNRFPLLSITLIVPSGWLKSLVMDEVNLFGSFLVRFQLRAVGKEEDEAYYTSHFTYTTFNHFGTHNSTAIKCGWKFASSRLRRFGCTMVFTHLKFRWKANRAMFIASVAYGQIRVTFCCLKRFKGLLLLHMGQRKDYVGRTRRWSKFPSGINSTTFLRDFLLKDLYYIKITVTALWLNPTRSETPGRTHTSSEPY